MLSLAHLKLSFFLSVVPEAMHEARQGPLKGAVLAQKAPQGSETELSIEGVAGKSVSQGGGH